MWTFHDVRLLLPQKANAKNGARKQLSLICKQAVLTWLTEQASKCCFRVERPNCSDNSTNTRDTEKASEMCVAHTEHSRQIRQVVSGIPVCGNEIFVRMWGIPRCCHFSGVLTTLAHQSLRLLVRPCTDYITTLLRGDHNCVEPFEKPFFFFNSLTNVVTFF